MSSNIDQMTKDFKDIAELKAYSDAQYKLVIELSKKIHLLEEENIHLKKLLENSTPLIKDLSSPIQIYSELTDEEAICRMELKKLKDLSIERDLNMEEAKRVEIYTKLITAMKQKGGEQSKDKTLSDDALLEFLNGTAEEQTK